MMRLSELYGKEIFTDSGKFVGSAQEFILDLENGVVERILLEPLPRDREKRQKVLREKTILFSQVNSIQDVIILRKGV